MKFKQLLETWMQSASPRRTEQDYAVRLPIDDAARIHALAELFPGHTREDIITDLLGTALQEIETALPYKPGTKVISQDDQGDPIYEDVGPTPKFEALVRKYKEQLTR